MLHRPLIPIDDDTEEAPWMVMGMPQSDAVTALYVSLRGELRSRHSPLLVATMLPIRYRPIPTGRVEHLAPDVLVARVEDYRRNSYDVEREGVAPSFVLEVVSPESLDRDLRIKPDRYERMGVEEYALFSPETPDGRRLLSPPLQGYRRDSVSGDFMPWEADEEGRLFSEVLGLWLVERAGELRLQRPDGSWVPTPDEMAEAHEHEALARRQLEAELARLRAELERRPEQ
jgi:hypothetical protein